MKTFLIVLHLFAADGTSTDVPMDNWVFTAQDQCARSVAFINQGQDVLKRLYTCQAVRPNDPTATLVDAGKDAIKRTS